MKSIKILLGFIIPTVLILGGMYSSYDLQKIDGLRGTDWVKLEKVSPYTVGAVVVAEDWAFYEHSGVDFNQLKQAIIDAVLTGERLRGASTITQQVAKNVYLTEERSVLRKLLELIVTLKLEAKLSKKEILEIYLNVAEFYPGSVGVKTGAEKFFKRSVEDLSILESAWLAMMLPNPKVFSDAPSFTRMKKLLEKMRMGKVITREEYDEGIRKLPSWRRWKD